ncbi:unnamed protein product, partial [Prorocentrum cordatum]
CPRASAAVVPSPPSEAARCPIPSGSRRGQRATETWGPPIWPRDRPPPPRSWRALRPEPEFNLQPIFRGGAMLDGAARGGYGKQGKRRREGLQTGRSRARCTAGRWTRARGAGTAAQREPEVLTQGTPGGQGGG